MWIHKPTQGQPSKLRHEPAQDYIQAVTNAGTRIKDARPAQDTKDKDPSTSHKACKPIQC